jgi:hypothetical protein
MFEEELIPTRREEEEERRGERRGEEVEIRRARSVCVCWSAERWPASTGIAVRE